MRYSLYCKTFQNYHSSKRFPDLEWIWEMSSKSWWNKGLQRIWISPNFSKLYAIIMISNDSKWPNFLSVQRHYMKILHSLNKIIMIVTPLSQGRENWRKGHIKEKVYLGQKVLPTFPTSIPPNWKKVQFCSLFVRSSSEFLLGFLFIFWVLLSFFQLPMYAMKLKFCVHHLGPFS